MKKEEIKNLRNKRDWEEKQILRAIQRAYNLSPQDCKKLLYGYVADQAAITKVAGTKTAQQELSERKPKAYAITK